VRKGKQNLHQAFDILLVEDSPADVEIAVEVLSNRDEDVSRCYRAGSNSYLTKPLRFDDCLKLVEDIQQYWLQVSRLPPEGPLPSPP
jgi:two-component system response regulator